MGIEIRAVGPDEIDQLELADQLGFAGQPPKPDASRSWTEGELDRTRVAFEGGRIVGASRTYSFDLTMPGGGCVPTAAVSWVSVLPTHRRRGVLTQMIAAMHDDARERGEPAAILTASESVIYGRYGYGVATWRLGLSAERARIEFRAPGDDDGSVRFVTRPDAETVLPAVYDAVRTARAGMVTRPDFWWPQVFWEWLAVPSKPSFVAVHADAHGRDDGYVVYNVTQEWSDGLPDRRLIVTDMQAASSDTWSALWRFVFGIDLVHTVASTNAPIDDPLRHLVVDGRRVRVDYVNDGLWLAPLDPVALLGARAYAVPGRVVIEVHMPDGSRSTVAVDSDRGGAQAAPTTDAPDLVCDAQALGMCVLGGNPWSELAGAGRVRASDPAALLLADAMFLTTPAPALLSYF